MTLLIEKHPQPDFFIGDIFDSTPFKDDMASMAHPIFTLSKKKDMRVLEYKKNNISILIAPNLRHGLPTIFDKDVLLYCGSLLMQEVNAGRTPAKTLRISSHDLLVATNRPTSGEGYMLLRKALDRLQSVSIRTNIKTHRCEQTSAFGLIDSYDIIESSRVKNRMIRLEVTLSDWFYNSIMGAEVLTISREYFRLGKPIERRLYEIARKHCGTQKQWLIGLEAIREKTGATSPLNKFRMNIKAIAKVNQLPDYTIEYVQTTDSIVFRNRGTWQKETPVTQGTLPNLPPDAYEQARKVAPRYDVYYLEQEFREWWHSTGKPAPKSVKAAFIGFCKQRHKSHPCP